MFTVPEAARQSGRHPETIRRWVRSGRLRSERVGTQYLIDEADLASMLDDRPLDLPRDWEERDDGARMPAWERVVRDSRSTH